MMSEQLITYTNALNGKQGLVKHDALHNTDNLDAGSLLLDVSQCIEAVSVLEKNTRMQIFTRFEDMDINPDTATLDEVFRNMPNETMLVLEAYPGYFPNMGIIPVILGEQQTGTLIITAGFSAGARFSLEFHSVKGVWHRRFNRYSNSNAAYKDSGWLRVETHGLQFEIESTHMTYLSNSLSNLKTPGSYSVNGTNMALFSDNPYLVTGLYTRISFIKIRRLFINGGIEQEVSSALGYPIRMVRTIDPDGTTSDWRVIFISNSGFSTNASFTASTVTATGGLTAQNTSTLRHTNPQATATYNLGGSGLTWNNLYVQNSPVVVSDGRIKPVQDVLTDQEIKCSLLIARLYKKYKLSSAIDEKGVDEARYHIGVIAQEVIGAFDSSGLDWQKYGVVTYEKWDAVAPVEGVPATYDEDGMILTEEVKSVEGQQAGDRYMVRYDELNCFVNAGIIASYDELENRLSSLEAK